MIWFLLFTPLGLALTLRLARLHLCLRRDWPGWLVTGGTLAALVLLTPILDGGSLRQLLR